MTHINFDDLETDFDGIDTTDNEHAYVEKCMKCNGTGKWVGGYTNRVVRTCFACKGAGHKEYQTSPEVRKAAKASRERNVVNTEKAGAEWLNTEHPVIAAWILDTSSWNDFAQSLFDSCMKYGKLTEGQIAAAYKSAEKLAAKAVAKAEKETETAIHIEAEGLAPILAAFNQAKESGLKRPKMRLDGFELKLAPATGKNEGHLYVMNGETYLGKITPKGDFLKPYSLSDEDRKEIDAKLSLVGQNPMEAAIAYGRRTGNCSCCGRALTRADSVERGMGAICASNFGF